ncbi:MAG TPA: YggT family protein [Candidatus Saccharimonadales bacterium]|nr:YggT family protein [Candidatus Saccharimonadales bacterium]
MIGRFLAGLINFFVAVVEIFLGLRVILRLFGANPANGFVEWIYNSSGVLMEPFRGIFPTETIAPDHVVDFSALFAMLVYALIGMAFLALATWLTPRDNVVVTKKARK